MPYQQHIDGELPPPEIPTKTRVVSPLTTPKSRSNCAAGRRIFKQSSYQLSYLRQSYHIKEFVYGCIPPHNSTISYKVIRGMGSKHGIQFPLFFFFELNYTQFSFDCE